MVILQVFTQRNFVADVNGLKLNFIKKNKKSLPLFGGLMGNIRTPSITCWKARCQLPIYHNWTFLCYLLLWRLRCYKRKSVKVDVFQRGWVTLSTNFRWKGTSPSNHCWCQKNRVTALWCGIKTSAVHCLALSQSTCVTDGRKDRITTPKTALA